MKKTICKYTKITAAIVVGVALSQSQLAMAGWTGAMNGTGYGQASVNVRAYGTSLLKKKTIATTNMPIPSVAMTNTSGYVFGGALPEGASPATVAKVIGYSGYIWDATTVGSNGDTTDNDELESRVNIVPADCATLDMTSSAVIAEDDKSGTITINANGTAGTAVWSRGFVLPEGHILPPDNPATTNINETLDYLKSAGSLKWDVLLVGPFDLTTNNCTAVTIPFTVETNASQNLYFVTDGVAKSLPLVIICPSNIVVNCSNSFAYPPVGFAGCGDVTLSYEPANLGVFPAGSFAVGVTPVKVTATDKDGNTTNCTFTVTVLDTTLPALPQALPTLTGESSVTVSNPPIAIDTCGSQTNTITGTTTDPTTYNSQGTFTVRWTFDDGNGNVLATNQTVTVDDVTAPVAPNIEPATGQCSVTVTAPTATDNVVGGVTGTTSNPMTYTAQGTYTITWTFNDGNGNTSTATQQVIVKDTIPPLKPTLATVTGSCGASVTLNAPTTTDNCAETVTGTTTTVFPITAAGTTVVTWTFSDGNGNSTTATQNVIVTGLTFNGFYSPIGGTGGSCASPLRTANLGNNLPVKFDETCGGSPYLTGRPTLSIEKANAQCQLSPVSVVNFTLVGNEWHFNWDTGSGGVTRGTYKLTATLQDGTTRFVWIKLK